MHRDHSLFAIATSVLSDINYKSYIFLFILFVVLTSDVFSSIFLKKINGATKVAGSITPYGVVIQGTLLVILHMLIDFFIRHDML